MKAQPNRDDLVMTDMTIPKMTGEVFTNKLKESIRSDIPVILCTGFSENIDETKAKKLGSSGYIEKPLDKRAFTYKVRRVLDKK